MMTRQILTLSLLIAGLILPISANSTASIPWYTIDSGGGSSSSSSPNSGLQLNGTLGQWDAGHLGSARYELRGGFWTGGENDRLFNDRFES